MLMAMPSGMTLACIRKCTSELTLLVSCDQGILSRERQNRFNYNGFGLQIYFLRLEDRAMTEYKLVVMGVVGVGRTALIVKFTYRHSGEYEPIIEDDFHIVEIIDDETCLLEIIESRHEEYLALRDQNTRRGQGYFCTYMVNSRCSFDEIASIHERIRRVRDEDKFPMVLVGNKCDLEEERQVSAVEGQNLAKSFSCPFYEASARTGLNVKEAFYELVREIRQYNEPKEETKKKGSPCTLS